MDFNGIIITGLVVGIIGLIIGILLGIAGEAFKVEVDEREAKINEILPGYNCGACGYSGCSGLAVAIVKGEAATTACPVGKAKVANAIEEIMSN